MRRVNIIGLLGGVVLLIVVSILTFTSFKSAVSARSSINVLTYNGNRAVVTNTISPHLRVVNKGTFVDNYFPLGTSINAMKSGAAHLSKQQVKVLIEQHVNAYWGVIQSTLGFTTKEKAYAFFLGLATRESTFQAALETGSGPSNSYGPLQTAQTAYANNKGWIPEKDVPEIQQYALNKQNFYDVGIAVTMGIRHMLHNARQSKAAGFRGIQFLRHALIGYNTGFVTNNNQHWLQQYSDEIGALAGWYLTNNHLYDTAFSWTGSPSVNRSAPWGWY